MSPRAEGNSPEIPGQHLPGNDMVTFRDKMMLRSKGMDIAKAWIVVDGSDAVTFMYAVAAQTGRPVTFLTSEEGKVDIKAVDRMVKYLSDNGIEVAGLMLDSGACRRDFLEDIARRGMQYLVTLGPEAAGHKAMMERHAQEIRWDKDHLVSLEGIFGISEYGHIFPGEGPAAYLNLFYDARKGCADSLDLLGKVSGEIVRLERVRDTGKDEPSAEVGLEVFIKEDARDGKTTFKPMVGEIFG